MGNVKFRPLFLIYVFLCVYMGWYNNIFYYIVAVVLHEYGHLLVAKALGYNTDGIVFDLYGAGLKSSGRFTRRDDIIVSLAGPCVNLLIILVVITFWWISPNIYSYTYDLVICNIYIMCFNLLPIYPLDMGRVIVAIFSEKLNNRIVLRISGIICGIVGGILTILFVISVFFRINLNMLFVGIFLIANSFLSLKNLKYDILQSFVSKKSKDSPVKLWKVKSLDNLNLMKLLGRDYYSIFVCVRSGKKYIKFEDDIFN